MASSSEPPAYDEVVDLAPQVSVTANGVESDTKVLIPSHLETNHYGYLADYPYDEKNQALYAINRRRQFHKMWSKVQRPHKRFHTITKDKICRQVLLWMGWAFSIAALIVAFVKEEFLEEGLLKHLDIAQVENKVLHLTIVELVFALIAVIISLIKNFVSYGITMRLQKAHVTTSDADYVAQKIRRNKRRFILLSLGIWTVGVIIIVGGFIVLFLKDQELHTELLYTKYTTIVTIFIALVIDDFISDMFIEAANQVKLDQCKLVIHQLKVELFHYLNQEGRGDRAELLAQYLDSRKLFSVPEEGHIVELPNPRYGDLQKADEFPKFEGLDELKQDEIEESREHQGNNLAHVDPADNNNDTSVSPDSGDEDDHEHANQKGIGCADNPSYSRDEDRCSEKEEYDTDPSSPEESPADYIVVDMNDLSEQSNLPIRRPLDDSHTIIHSPDSLSTIREGDSEVSELSPRNSHLSIDSETSNKESDGVSTTYSSKL